MNEIDRLKAEISIMKPMDHPNSIKLYENSEDQENSHLIMELCTGGGLFDSGRQDQVIALLTARARALAGSSP